MMREANVRQLTDEQLADAVERYDRAALTLHRVLSLQVVRGAEDYCALERACGTEMDWLAPAIREWCRRCPSE